MRRILLYILLFVLLCFAIPIVLTQRQTEQGSIAVKTEEPQENTVENQTSQTEAQNHPYHTIKLWHAKSNQVEEVALEEYLYSVVSAEMPASFEKEALKAQAIVARTYTIYKIKHNSTMHEGADICDQSTCCQAWISKEDRLAKWEESSRASNWEKIVEAVDSTKGKVITYEGEPINAFFHSNSGGKTETTMNVWGGSGYPYLQSVATSGEENYTQYASEVSFNEQDFIHKIKEKHADFSIDFAQEDAIKVLEYTDGNRVKTIQMGNLSLSGVEVRTLLGLKSANFSVKIEGENITFSVIGYGHGVGMSQTGADSLAKQGKQYEEIIKHFYTGVEIVDL